MRTTPPVRFLGQLLGALPRATWGLLLLSMSSCATDDGVEQAPPSKPAEAEPAPPAPVAIEVSDEERRVALASGASVPVPARWTGTKAETALELVGPDGEANIQLVELDAKTATVAAASVVATLAPELEGREKQTQNPPAQDGFEEVLVETWSFPGGERFARLMAFRQGTTVWCFLVQGPVSAIARRGAHLRAIVGGLEAPGVEEETLAGRTPHPFDDEKQKVLDAYLAEVRERVGVPGASVAVVQGGRVVWAKGYGVLGLDDDRPMTPEARMMIGSITKSMTTLLMGTLVDEGKLTWDAKVRDVFPELRLLDEKVTDQLEMQHLVCACTGVARRDFELIFEFKNQTPQTMLEGLKTLPTTTGFQETFQYSNQMVAAAGFVSARVAHPKMRLGTAYDRAMTERVFEKMGLMSATLDFRELGDRPQALPHDRGLDGKFISVPLEREEFVLPIRPSGGAWMSTNDLGRYVATELRRGLAPAEDGQEPTRVASSAAVEERWKPRVKASADSSYGLGWGVGEDRGLKVVAHSGGTLGFNAYAVFLPEHDVGLAAMVNGSGGHIWNQTAWRRLVELLFDAKPIADAKLAFSLQAEEEARAKLREKLKAIPPDVLESAAGKYRAELLGPIDISRRKDDLVVDAGEWTSKVAFREEEGRRFLVLVEPPLTSLGLELKEDGTLVLVEAQHEHVFTKL